MSLSLTISDNSHAEPQLTGVSLCLPSAADTEGILEAVNSHLPAQIRVFDLRRVTKRFDAKLQCSARSYQYMSPTFAFTPLEGVVSEQYR